MATEKITRERLSATLSYDPDTGAFVRKVTCANNRAGTVAGGVNLKGYISIAIGRQRYLAHRLAWLYVHGKWPEGQIDHINLDRTDNRIQNLRDVSHATNQQNQARPHSHNKLGVMGVRRTATGAYAARITVNGKERYIGTYETPEAASAAYLKVKRELHDGCTI